MSAQKTEQQQRLKDLEKRKADPAPLDALPLVGDELDPWMGQYNRNRVAQKLVSLGADESLSLKAGERVQSYVLVRTARRRIRLFLRERDSLWNEPDGEMKSSQQLLESAKPRHPKYGFDDVVEVMLDVGLTGVDICAILSHSPSLAQMMPRESFAATNLELSQTEPNEETDGLNGVGVVPSPGETLEETLTTSFSGLLLTTLGMRKYDARKVLRSCPGLLSVRGSKSAVQVVAMMTKLGVSTNSIGRDKTSLPVLLSRSPAGLFRLISFLTSDTVRIPVKTAGPLVRRTISRELLDAVVPVLRLQPLENTDSSNEEDEGLDPNVESALWGRSREERTKRINAIYKNMTATAMTLRNEIGTKDLGKVVAAYPSVLLLNAEEQILPTAAFLMDELGILEGDLPRVLQLFPVLLGKSTDEMKEVASYLLSLGVEEEDLGSIFRAFPGLLTMDTENDMMPVVKYLKSIGVVNIGAFVTRLPPILSYSVENDLKPKWEFLKKVCMYADFELNKFPAYFSYPFERVIKTRYDYLAARGVSRHLVPVDAVLRFGDVDFATRVARDDDEGKVFQKFCERRRQAQEGPPKKKTRRRRAKKEPVHAMPSEEAST